MVTPPDPEDYFHKKNPRPGQLDAIRKAATATADGKAAIIRAPTGSGKTAMGLLAVLPLLCDEDRLVFFAARTHAQNRQVLKEARFFNAHASARGLPFRLRVVPLVGRTKACLKMQTKRGDDWESFAQQCTRFRAKGKCEYYMNLKANLTTKHPVFGPTSVIDAQEATEFCQKHKLCLYYYLFAHLPEANLAVGSYNYILNPAIRQVLLQDDVLRLEDIVVIFDEAHNLPDLCRKMASRDLAQKMLDDACVDLKNRGDFLAARLKSLHADTRLQRLFPKSWQFLVNLVKSWVVARDAFDASVRAFQDEFLEDLRGRLEGLPSYDMHRYESGHEVEMRMEPDVLDSLLPPADLARLNDSTVPSRARQSTLVDRYVEAVYESLWEALDDAKQGNEALRKELPFDDAGWADFVNKHQLGGEKLEDLNTRPVQAIVNFMAHRTRYIVDGNKDFAFIARARREAPLYYFLSITCFDARVAFTHVRDNSAGIVCMSGSMDKRDLAMLGIPSPARGMQDISDFPVLVPPDHWLVLVDPEDMTDRALRTTNKWKSIADRVVAIASETPGGVGVFCRNYDHVDKLAGALGPIIGGKKVFVEEPGERRNPRFINDYKDIARQHGAILVACTYGKYGEGEDFPGAEMNAAIVVGYPYPPRSATQMGLATFLDTVFPGEGEQVAFNEAAVKRVAQVAGRCVRSETDRGLVLLIDQRMGSDSFVAALPGSLQAVTPVEDYAAILPRVRKFFAPYLDFLLQQGNDASRERDPGERTRKARRFLATCKIYFSDRHPPWNNDPKLTPRMREIQQLKHSLSAGVP